VFSPVLRIGSVAAIGAVTAIAAAPTMANYHLEAPVVGVDTVVAFSMSFDPVHRELYILDSLRQQIDVYGGSGGFIRSWGGGSLCKFDPGGLAFDPATETVFLSEESQSRVDQCTPTGGWLGRYRTHLTPGALAIMPASSRGPWLMYLGAGDYDNEFEIIHRNGDWRIIDPSGPGALPGPPVDIAADPAARVVYVSDFNYTNVLDSRIEKFSADGHFLRGWQFYNAAGKPAEVGDLDVADNGDILAAGDRRCVQIYSPTGQRVGEFACDSGVPGSIASTGDGGIYVSDSKTGAVSLYHAIKPATKITSGPIAGEHWADPTPLFAFSSSESGGTFRCRIDSGSWSDCPTPHTTGHLGDGTHTISVRAIDGDDLEGPITKTSFTIDTRPPELAISGRPVTLTHGGAAMIELTCPGSETSGPCSGSLFLHTQDRRTVHGKALDPLLGIAAFNVPSGNTKPATVKLSSRDQQILASLRAVTASVVVNVSDRVGNRTTGITKAFKLKAP
jgi:DNA-binding beta-propeller fold protein YncE